MFSSRSLLGLPRLSNKCMTEQFRTALIKRLKELSLSLVASIINPGKQEWLQCIRLPSLRCTRPPSLWCALSVRDSLYRWCTPTLQGCYLSPSEYQAYKTYYLYFQSTPRSLQGLSRPPKSCGSPDRSVPIVIELLELYLQGQSVFRVTTKKFEPQSFVFPLQSPIGLGGFSSTSLSHSPVSWLEF